MGYATSRPTVGDYCLNVFIWRTPMFYKGTKGGCCNHTLSYKKTTKPWERNVRDMWLLECATKGWSIIEQC